MNSTAKFLKVYEIVWKYTTFPDNERKTYLKRITAESFLHALGKAEVVGLDMKPRLRASDITKIEFLHAVEHDEGDNE